MSGLWGTVCISVEAALETVRTIVLRYSNVNNEFREEERIHVVAEGIGR